MANKKFSDFVDGNESQIGDEIVGLRSGTNYRFDFPGDGIKDANGNYLFKYSTAGATAVNYIEIVNGNASLPAQIVSGGSDTDVDIQIAPKNSGEINLDSEIVTVNADIQHEGDSDNKITFTTDTQTFSTGGSSRMDITDSGVRFGAANSRITTILDEDNMASDSDTALATQQSIKAYVDAQSAGTNFSKAARVATTGNLASTYDNGTAGVGATLTATSNGAASIDSVSLSVNDLVLFKDQSNAFENGIYYLSTNGTAGTPSIFTRIDYFDEAVEMTYGELVGIVEGTVNLRSIWQLTSVVGTVGTDALDFQFMVIDAPESVTDDALVKFDGTTGKVIQNSVGILTDAGALSGITQLDVDNIRIDGNSISSTDAAGNINFEPDTTGLVFINSGDAGSTGIGIILDEDNMASDSDTALATQQSIKAYVDGTIGSSAIPQIGSSTDEAIVRWDGTGGDAVQNSLVTISDTGVMSGITQLNVDNIRIDGNTITSTDAAGNINITPDTTGDLVLDGTAWPQAAAADGQLLLGNGAGTTGWSASLADGQIIIGQTGGTAGAANLTAGPGIAITNGANAITVSSTGGGYAWTEVTGTSQAMDVNNGYIANNAGLVTCTLPATAAVGDTVSVQGKGAGLFRIAQNAGQTINFGASATTTGAGGYLEATNQFDSIELLCITANTDWAVLTGPQGTLTVV